MSSSVSPARGCTATASRWSDGLSPISNGTLKTPFRASAHRWVKHCSSRRRYMSDACFLLCNSDGSRAWHTSPAEDFSRIKGLAHITGGGLLENIPRVLLEGCHAIVDAGQWALPAIFSLIQQGGRIAPEEMARTFNCGIGMAVIVSRDSADEIVRELESVTEEDVFEIGRIEDGQRGCTVAGTAAVWNSGKDWSVTHNA